MFAILHKPHTLFADRYNKLYYRGMAIGVILTSLGGWKEGPYPSFSKLKRHTKVFNTEREASSELELEGLKNFIETMTIRNLYEQDVSLTIVNIDKSHKKVKLEEDVNRVVDWMTLNRTGDYSMGTIPIKYFRPNGLKLLEKLRAFMGRMPTYRGFHKEGVYFKWCVDKVNMDNVLIAKDWAMDNDWEVEIIESRSNTGRKYVTMRIR